MKKKSPSRIRPWPNSTFSILIEVERNHGDRCKHVRVHLKREAPGRHGQLKAMHAIIPLRKHGNDAGKHFASASCRLNKIRAATEVLFRAGVSEDQAKDFMLAVAKEYPCPSKQELFLEHLNNPLVSMALDARRNELSYFKTGVPEWTKADVRLVEVCMDDLLRRSKTDSSVRDRVMEIVLHRPAAKDT